METTEKLSHGMYCDVTREQAVELLTIEGDVKIDSMSEYVTEFFNEISTAHILYMEYIGCILSFDKHGDFNNKLPFPDFKERLVNTVNNK